MKGARRRLRSALVGVVERYVRACTVPDAEWTSPLAPPGGPAGGPAARRAVTPAGGAVGDLGSDDPYAARREARVAVGT
ncbi:hypothetical protein LRS74_29400 [Streptomyces sp. LX-29]|uniref:hypothetical protein n=1 Tax=Streptomyces sp. LX-29 TaxID=2900152 RepID=UPI00240E9055|nr:hypothetical protein [Streptomyces sp. LX-29]WFB10692.1 hypothetical protein LRS74_29400 [Streptomyces sp. LX-29]